MTDAVSVFVAQFVMVFALGYQSQCVRDGDYLAACVVSLVLGLCGLVITPVIADRDLLLRQPETLAAFLFSGPPAICFSIFIHKRTRSKKVQK